MAKTEAPEKLVEFKDKKRKKKRATVEVKLQVPKAMRRGLKMFGIRVK